MILILGSSSDPVSVYFKNFLQQNSKPYLFFDQRALGYRNFLYENYLTVDNQKYYYKDFSGCYNRICKINYLSNPSYTKQEKILPYVINYKLNNVVIDVLT